MSELRNILEYGVGGDKLLIPKAEQDIIDLFSGMVSDEVQPCEPDCTPERHAYHQGQWDMGERLYARFRALSNKEEK